MNAYIWYQGGMTLVVNINDWLVGDDLPAGPPRLRRNALRVVRFIEYGGPLEQLHGARRSSSASIVLAAFPAPAGCGW